MATLWPVPVTLVNRLGVSISGLFTLNAVAAIHCELTASRLQCSLVKNTLHRMVSTSRNAGSNAVADPRSSAWMTCAVKLDWPLGSDPMRNSCTLDTNRPTANRWIG